MPPKPITKTRPWILPFSALVVVFFFVVVVVVVGASSCHAFQFHRQPPNSSPTSQFRTAVRQPTKILTTTRTREARSCTTILFLAKRVISYDDDDDDYNDDSQQQRQHVVVEEATYMKRLKQKRSQHSIGLVDDEEDIRQAVSTFLRDSGFQVTTFEDAPTALDYLLTGGDGGGGSGPRLQPQHQSIQPPAVAEVSVADIVISDVRMPDSNMDGIEFVHQLRSNPQTISLPVILLTAKGQTMDRITGYNAGADAFIPKPFDPQELVTICDNLIDKQELLFNSKNKDNEINIQDLQRYLNEIKHLLLSQGGGGSAIQMEGFVQATNVFLAQDEQQVLEWLCQGRTNKEIASKMFLSSRRVEQLLTRMYRKASVSNRTELVRWAVATGHVRLNNINDDE